MTQDTIKKIIIAGSGLTAWTAAIAIAKSFLNTELSVVVLGDETSHEEAPYLLPQAMAFHRHLEIDERVLMRATDATFSVGTQFEDWNKKGHNFFMPFGPHGSVTEFIDFQHFAIKSKLSNSFDGAYEDYAFATAVAKAGKFMHPQNDPSSLLSTLPYSINLNPTKYLSLLKNLAKQIGVIEIAESIGEVNLEKEGAFIQSIESTVGNLHEADFFVDCTGQAAQLLGQALKTKYTTWSQWLPMDKKVSYETTTESPLKANSKITGLDAGFLRSHSNQNTTIHEISFCSAETTLEATLKQLGFIEDELTSVEKRTFSSGKRDNQWVNNCIAFGEASVNFPSLEVSKLQLVQEDVMRFIQLFPNKNIEPSLSHEYNRVTERRYNNLRDYLILNFVFSSRSESSLWQDIKRSDYPKSLSDKMRLFREHGKIAFNEDEIFMHQHWTAKFIGLGYWPINYDIFLDKFNFQELQENFVRMRNAIQQAIPQMPDHEDYLKQGLG
jgi:tryptophan halogenase